MQTDKKNTIHTKQLQRSTGGELNAAKQLQTTQRCKTSTKQP